LSAQFSSHSGFRHPHYGSTDNKNTPSYIYDRCSIDSSCIGSHGGESLASFLDFLRKLTCLTTVSSLARQTARCVLETRSSDERNEQVSSRSPFFGWLSSLNPIAFDRDYSMTAPLEKDGSNYPAKSRCTAEILASLSPVATLVSGEEFTWNLLGTAVHNGGSCQVGVSYDACSSMVVLASWIGGCPLSLPYTFKVPDIPGADKAFFWWSWSNQSGNRELYQNVAVVAITGTASEFTGPTVFRANTFGEESYVLS